MERQAEDDERLGSGLALLCCAVARGCAVSLPRDTDRLQGCSVADKIQNYPINHALLHQSQAAF